MHDIERIWRRSFDEVANSLPESWVVRGDDDFVGIDPQYRSTPQVRLYHGLLCAGYAKGWL